MGVWLLRPKSTNEIYKIYLVNFTNLIETVIKL